MEDGDISEKSKVDTPTTAPQTGIKESEETKRYPTYIDETLRGVNEHSGEQLVDFLDGEPIRDHIESSIWEETQLQVISELYPRAYQKHLGKFSQKIIRRRKPMTRTSKLSWKVNMRETPEETARRDLLSWVKMYGDPKFNKEVRRRVEVRSSELFEIGTNALESSSESGSVMVVSLSAENAIAFLRQGEYVPILDTSSGYPSFPEAEKELINLFTTNKFGAKDLERKRENVGLGTFAARYFRELELGIYPPDSEGQTIKHPVYGQMVVSEQSELHRAAQEGYGNVHIKLKEDRVKNRTTFVVGDSIADRASYNQQLNWHDAEKARMFINTIADEPNIDWRALPSYIEAHVMGGVSLEDVDEIVFKAGEDTETLLETLGADESFQIEKDTDGLMRAKYVGDLGNGQLES